MPDTSDTLKKLQATLDTGAELLAAHGLAGWRMGFDRARTRAGKCDYKNRVITLSGYYVFRADPADIRDTLLHEIAHALVGPKHGHDAVWAAKARAIGCSAMRCHSLEFTRGRWLVRCPNGCFSAERHRRRANMVCKKCRAPIEYAIAPRQPA